MPMTAGCPDLSVQTTPTVEAGITIFSCPRSFEGHFGIIQRNAILSWTLLKPRPDIILLGDDAGTAEICEELGLRHIPDLQRTESGMPLVNSIFDRAEAAAKCEALGYVNTDIVLFQDFIDAFAKVRTWKRRYLMIGCRMDLDLRVVWNFGAADWDTQLRARAEREGAPMTLGADYFVFPRGLFAQMPPFVVGSTSYDNWFFWFARHYRVPVVDTSSIVLAIHQVHRTQHDWAESLKAPAVRRNHALASAWQRSYGPADSTHELVRQGIKTRGIAPYLNRLRWAASLAAASARSSRSLRILFGKPPLATSGD